MSEGKKVDSRRKDRTAIRVDGNWFPCTTAVGEFVSNGDIITIEEYGPEKNDRGEKIIKKVKMLEKAQRPGANGAAKGTNPSYTGGKKNDDYQVGVSVGHAYNVAVQLAVAQKGKSVTADIVDTTARDVYSLVEKMKEDVKAGKLSPTQPEKKEAPAAKSEPEQGDSEDDPEEPPF